MKPASAPVTQENHAVNAWGIPALQVIGAALAIGLCAHIKIPLLFTPIPLSLQTLALLLSGALLGSRKGVAAAALYVAWGALGVPVFAGGAPALAHIIGPSGGYILGFVVLAFLAGKVSERIGSGQWTKAALGFAGCCLVQLAMGTAWLGVFVGWENALTMGLLPFLPGELIKSAVAAAFAVKARDR